MQRRVLTPANYIKPVAVAGKTIVDNMVGRETVNSMLNHSELKLPNGVIISPNEINTDFTKFKTIIGVRCYGATAILADQKVHDGEGGEYLFGSGLVASEILITEDSAYNCATNGVAPEIIALYANGETVSANIYIVRPGMSGAAAYYDKYVTPKGNLGNRLFSCGRIIVRIAALIGGYSEGQFLYNPSITLVLYFSAGSYQYFATFEVFANQLSSSFMIDITTPVWLPDFGCSLEMRLNGYDFGFNQIGEVFVYRDYSFS
jgi:hypothetical protein